MMRNNRGIEEPYLKIDSFIDSHVPLQHVLSDFVTLVKIDVTCDRS